MQAYAARQEVNAQVREQAGRMRLRPPAVQLPEHLREIDPDYHRFSPIVFGFGRGRPSSRRGGSRI